MCQRKWHLHNDFLTGLGRICDTRATTTERHGLMEKEGKRTKEEGQNLIFNSAMKRTQERDIYAGFFSSKSHARHRLIVTKKRRGKNIIEAMTHV